MARPTGRSGDPSAGAAWQRVAPRRAPRRGPAGKRREEALYLRRLAARTGDLLPAPLLAIAAVARGGCADQPLETLAAALAAVLVQGHAPTSMPSSAHIYTIGSVRLATPARRGGG